MPVLANQRWEKFARALAEGRSITGAYVEAGYRESRASACRLSTNASIQQRVVELQARAADLAVVSKSWIMESLKQVAERSMTEAELNPAGANRALELLGKELGMFIDRKEVGVPGEFEGLNAEQRNSLKRLVDRELEGRTEGVGQGRAAEPAPEIPTLQ